MSRTMRRGDLLTQPYDLTGASIYARLERELDAAIWDGVAGALAATPTLANSKLAMTEKNRTWSVAIPAALPCGSYLVSCFLMAGADAASTDERINSERITVVQTPGE